MIMYMHRDADKHMHTPTHTSIATHTCIRAVMAFDSVQLYIVWSIAA